MRLDHPGCDLVTHGEEAASRQVSADCAALPPAANSAWGGVCGKGSSVPSVSMSATVTASRLQHEEKGGEG